MDKASDFESEDCRFESCHGQFFFLTTHGGVVETERWLEIFEVSGLIPIPAESYQRYVVLACLTLIMKKKDREQPTNNHRLVTISYL